MSEPQLNSLLAKQWAEPQRSVLIGDPPPALEKARAVRVRGAAFATDSLSPIELVEPSPGCPLASYSQQ